MVWVLALALVVIAASFVAGALYGRRVAAKAIALEQAAKDSLIKGIEKL